MAGTGNSTQCSSGNRSACDFNQPDPPVTDVVLVVSGQRFYLNKSLLALHSPYFRTMFFSDFSERSKEEVELGDVCADEFLELLHVIYPPLNSIHETNVKPLLKMADRLQIQCVVDKCETFLLGLKFGKEITLAKKFLLAEQYRLSHLHEWCVGQLGSFADVQALEKTEEYRQLSDKMKVAVLEKAVGFGKPTTPAQPDYNNYLYCPFCARRWPCPYCAAPSSLSNVQKENNSSCSIDMRDLMRMEVYCQLNDGGKLALLQKALGF